MQHKRRRPRALTLTLPDAKRPFLVLEGKKYTLRNFSQEGIGLWMPTPFPFGLTPGSRISGDVLINNEIFPVKLEIRHQSAQVVGLQIVNQSAELAKIFDELLEPAKHAGDLDRHPQSETEDSNMGYPRIWYRAGTEAELVVWYNDSQKMIVSLQLCWLGRWVFRQQFKPPQTGYLKDEERRRPGTLADPAEILIRHTEADEEILQQAAQFLGALASPLPGYRLWQFLEMGEQIYLPAELFVKQEVA